MSFIYLILVFIFMLTFLLIKKTDEKLDAITWLLYGIMLVMSWQGIASFFLYFLKLPLSFSSLSISLFIGASLIVSVNIRIVNKKIIFPIQQYLLNKTILFSIIVAFICSVTASILFFTPYLIPSSMTGDPPRHYLSLMDLTKSSAAIAHKPIYYICCSAFMYTFKDILYEDQLFLLYNIICLLLVTFGIIFILIKILPNVKKQYIFLCILLTCFGYPLFALQYGYFTLLLSSAFLFFEIALCLEYFSLKKANHIYLLITLLLTGVIFTHSYLVPQMFLGLIVFSFFFSKNRSISFLETIKCNFLYWTWLIIITYISNAGLGAPVTETIAIYKEVITVRGFVNNDFFISLFPFLIISIPFMIFSWKIYSTKIISFFVFCGSLFTLFMYILMLIGYAAPYYVNRNLIFLMPLLIILSILGINQIENFNKKYSRILVFIYFLFVCAPYLSLTYKPLSQSGISFLSLKEINQPTYFETALITRYSPLQMTRKDRKLLRSIGKNKEKYFKHEIKSLPVLGSDHEVLWFYIYTNIYPSLFSRKDDFTSSTGYVENYKIWRDDSSKQYLVLIKHMNYNIPYPIIRDVESRSTVLVEGDSFKILVKKSSF